MPGVMSIDNEEWQIIGRGSHSGNRKEAEDIAVNNSMHMYCHRREGMCNPPVCRRSRMVSWTAETGAACFAMLLCYWPEGDAPLGTRETK